MRNNAQQPLYDSRYTQTYASAMALNLDALQTALAQAETRFTEYRKQNQRVGVSLSDEARGVWAQHVAEIDALRTAIVDKILGREPPKAAEPEPDRYTDVVIHGQELVWDEKFNTLHEKDEHGVLQQVGTFNGSGFEFFEGVEERLKAKSKQDADASYKAYVAKRTAELTAE